VAIQVKQYSIQDDYNRVGDFLQRTYDGTYHHWLQARWEYMHYHPNFNESNVKKIGLFEENGKIVAVANYEENLGQAYFQYDKQYQDLKPRMLQYAEDNLFEIAKDNQKKITIYIDDNDSVMEELALLNGYKKNTDYPEYRSHSVMDLVGYSLEYQLPSGYKITSLEEETDINKYHQVLWSGFNHDGTTPKEDLVSRYKMQSAPNYDRSLNIVAVSPDGEFASHGGIWYDPINKIGYVEPVATPPQYRRLGLAKACVLEGVKRVKEKGAERIYVGSGQKFYLAIGFKLIHSSYPWEKIFSK